MIRLALPALLVALVASQFVIPPLAERKVASRLTDHGGSATVDLRAFPALKLLFGRGGQLDIRARGLSVDLDANRSEVFQQLDDFSDVDVEITNSRAGPFAIASFRVNRTADNAYAVAISGDGNAADVARYAGSRLAGGFGQALAGLATAALGGFDRMVPFDARMRIDTGTGKPVAQAVQGQVDGFPAGPLAEIVANALLRGL